MKKYLNTGRSYSFNPLATKGYGLLDWSIKSRGQKRGESYN